MEKRDWHGQTDNSFTNVAEQLLIESGWVGAGKPVKAVPESRMYASEEQLMMSDDESPVAQKKGLLYINEQNSSFLQVQYLLAPLDALREPEVLVCRHFDSNNEIGLKSVHESSMGPLTSRNGGMSMFFEGFGRQEDSVELEQRARQQYGRDDSFKASLQRWFIENHKISLRIRLVNLFFKLLSCVLYCVRAVNDSPAGKRLKPGDNYDRLIWVEPNYWIWSLQTVVACVSLLQTVALFYISYKGNFCRLLFNIQFLLEMITSFPFIVTIFVPGIRELYVPAFLNCWLAKSALGAMLNDLNRDFNVHQSALFRQMLVLLSILVCLVFTGMCCMEHFQRLGNHPFDLFTCFYFIMVTLSTVGYGDVYPDTWLSRLVIVIIICVTLSILPSQLESLVETVVEKQQSGSDLGTFGHTEEHVVVTVTHLDVEFIRDFLTEFYAHPENQGVITVLLSPSDLNNAMKMLLRIPLWSSRVFYVRGTALVDEDLERARLSSAKVCFILSARNVRKKVESDQHTILRSWAVKDFAPHVPQYVQIFRPETKMYLEHAEEMLCEDEFKYGLLANNCICPGLSTFLTLLVHTSQGEEGQKSSEPWHKVYGFHSGNEIYEILVENSQFFGEYIGSTFTYASFHAHRRFGVGLLAIRSGIPGSKIMLNPGLNHIIEPSDTVYYMALTNEESLREFKRDISKQQRKVLATSNIANVGSLAMEAPPPTETVREKRKKMKLLGRITNRSKQNELLLTDMQNGDDSTRRPSIANVEEGNVDSSSSDSDDEDCRECGKGKDCIKHHVIRGCPPVKAYIGTSPTICHMMKKKRDTCCLQIKDKPCSHTTSNQCALPSWQSPSIILAADKTSSGMYNFLIPLRAYYRPVHSLRPVILLMELNGEEPNDDFLDVIAYFPMVFWMSGTISNLDSLLRAGIHRAAEVLVVKETAAIAEAHSADCEAIITVQKIHRMFPKVRMITELTHSSNMRFVQFDPFNPLEESKFEKKERKRGSNMPFMFRLPFAQGGVFSANMMDRLLYQAVVKPFLVDFVRLLLGIDQTVGSGYLESLVITQEDMWIKTYGRLYQKLCGSTADIPIGLFRTKKMDSKTVSVDIEERCRAAEVESSSKVRRKDVVDMVQNRMRVLGIGDENEVSEKPPETSISYVIINPALDMQLEVGDVVYIIHAPVAEDVRNRKVNPRRGLRRSEPVRESSLP